MYSFVGQEDNPSDYGKIALSETYLPAKLTYRDVGTGGRIEVPIRSPDYEPLYLESGLEIRG